MAEETLVKEALSPEMVEAGRELIRALGSYKVQLTACFWLYSEESNDWKLAVCFPEVDTKGPRKGYELIQSVTRPPSGPRQIDATFDRLFQLFDDVVVLGPSNKLVQSVIDVPLDPNSSGARFKRSRLGDSYFDDVYIYNLAKLNGTATS